MRTPIEIDDHFLVRVQPLGRFATQKAAVNTALAELPTSSSAASFWNFGATFTGKETWRSCAPRETRNRPDVASAQPFDLPSPLGTQQA